MEQACESKKTVCIVTANARSLINFRIPLIKSWIKLNYRVVCISIEEDEELVPVLEPIGAEYYRVPGSRTGIGLTDGFKMMRDYKRAFDTIKPDYVYLYLSKPLAFGGWAAVKSKVPHINCLISGLENAYYRKSLKDALVRLVMDTFYRYVLPRSENVFFQNRDDIEFLDKRRALNMNNVHLVNGSGVDMDYFAKKALPDKPVILMVSRLLWSKGIREFLAASQIVKKEKPETEIILVGGLDINDEAISKQELDEIVSKGVIEYCGQQNDVRPYLERSSIFVLPSYHEGLPRSVLEAMATGRPIITTMAPGCKDTVEEGVNGFRVPVADSEALAQAMLKLVNDSDLRRSMAEASYKICSEKYDVNLVNEKTNEIMFGGNNK